MDPRSGDGGPLEAPPSTRRRGQRKSSQGSRRSRHQVQPRGAEGDGEHTALLPRNEQPGYSGATFTKGGGGGGEREDSGRGGGAVAVHVAARGRGEERGGGREGREEREGEGERREGRGERREEMGEGREEGGEVAAAEGREEEERDQRVLGVAEGRGERERVKECNLVPQFVLDHMKLWSSICSGMICLLILISLASIGLIIYTTFEVEEVASKSNKNLQLSTTEVYQLGDWVKGLDLYTNQVCIKQMSKVDFEKLMKSKVKVYMEKASCTDIFKKKRERKITNSFTPHNHDGGELDFFWISNTNFSFYFKVTSVPDSGNLTVYITDSSHRRQCHDDYQPSGGVKLVFPFSDQNNSFINCTYENGTTVCESTQIVVNETKHYYTCMFFSSPYSGAHADYDMHIHEVIYEASDSHRQLCHLNESDCCYAFKNILKEADDPTCVLITTEAEGNHNIAKDMPVALTITTSKNLQGILYSFCAFCIVVAVLILVACVSLYTCYRKGHPGHCCRFNL